MGVRITNSTVVVSSSYIITSGIGVSIKESGLNALVPFIQSDVIVGNINGIFIDGVDAGSVVAPMNIDGNTIALNQVGVSANVVASSPILADVGDNIFWENHDLTAARNGTGVISTFPNKIGLRGNLFSGNGPSESDPSDDVINIGGGFLLPTLGPVPGDFGNFTGNPAFVAPRDPRPGAGGPAGFFLDANFDLTADSAAIDAAIEGFLPSYDLLYRSRVDIPGRGFTGTGPGDVGAFEFQGVGGLAAGGAFRVASTSFATDGSALAAGRSVSTQALGNAIVVTFSGPIDPSTLDATDLVLSGNGLDPTNPAHAVGFTLIDDHTVQFLLAGSFNTSGIVNVTIPAGAIKSKFQESMLGFSDSAQVTNAATTTPATTTTTTTPTPAPTPAATPVPTGNRRRHRRVHVGQNHPVARQPRRQQRQVHRPRQQLLTAQQPNAQFGVKHPKRKANPFA